MGFLLKLAGGLGLVLGGLLLMSTVVFAIVGGPMVVAGLLAIRAAGRRSSRR